MEHPDPSAPPVTFRHLLTHTLGVGELRSLTDLFRPTIGLGVKPGQPIPTPNEYYAAGLTAEVYPGTKWAYGNHAFATLRQLVEDISGEPFSDYMIKHVFEPLGMHHTDYVLSDRVRDQLAKGYQFKRGKLTPVKYLEIAVRAAGSIFSSVSDMSKYMIALLNGGKNEYGAVLKEETLRLMLQPHYQLDEHLPAMGLAFILDQLDGHRIAGHDGGWHGFVSSMLLAPDDGLGVVIFTNTTSLAPNIIARDLLRRMLDLPDPASQLPRRGVLESPHLWPELCGSYRPEKGLNTNARIWMGFGGEVEVYVKNNHLALRSLVGPLWKGVTLYPIDNADPLVMEAVHQKQVLQVVFKRNESGYVDRLQLGFNSLYKHPKIQSLRYRGLASLGGLAGLTAAVLGRRMLKRQRAEKVSRI